MGTLVSQHTNTDTVVCWEIGSHSTFFINRLTFLYASARNRPIYTVLQQHISPLLCLQTVTLGSTDIFGQVHPSPGSSLSLTVLLQTRLAERQRERKRERERERMAGAGALSRQRGVRE